MNKKIFSLLFLAISFSFALEGMDGQGLAQGVPGPDSERELIEQNPTIKPKGKEKEKIKPKKRRYAPREHAPREKRLPGVLGITQDTIRTFGHAYEVASFLPREAANIAKTHITQALEQKLESDKKDDDSAREIERLQAMDYLTLEQTDINARQQRKAHVQGAKASAKATAEAWITFIKEKPYLLVGIASATAAGFFAAKNSMKVLFDEIQKRIGLPKLAKETSLLTVSEKIAKRLGLRKEPVLRIDDLIFNEKFKARMVSLTESLKHTVANKGTLRNLLFYGKPGIGKTLTAKTIAQNSTLHYVILPASNVAKMSEKDALNQLTELFEFAKRSSEKLMIVIDEAEILFADRGNSDLDNHMKKVLNLILTYTGTESEDYCVVALTNRPEDLDEAVLSRFDEQIEFPAPTFEETKTLLSLYIKKSLMAPRMVKSGWFGRKTAKSISIEPGALDAQAIDAIAHKITGFVGRDIAKLVVAFQAEAFATKRLILTKHMIDEIVDRKIEEKRKAELKFKSA